MCTAIRPNAPSGGGGQNFLVALLFLPLILFYQMPHAPHSSRVGAGSTLGSITLAFGTIGQFYAISLLGSFRYSLLMKLEPLCATVFAALLISEFLKMSQYFGILLVIGSLAIYQIMDQRRRKYMMRILTATAHD